MTLNVNISIGLQIESPQFSRAAQTVVVVGDKEVSIVRGDNQTIGAVHFVSDDSRNGSVEINPIDTFNMFARSVDQLHPRAVAILRVGEVDPAT